MKVVQIQTDCEVVGEVDVDQEPEQGRAVELGEPMQVQSVGSHREQEFVGV